MDILQAVLSALILGFLYYRMVKRETPSPISWLQALTPIGLGMVSLPVSFYAFIGVSMVINSLGISAGGAHPFVRSLLFAFMMAGCPEELTKLLFMLIAIFLFRKRIRNVYEYILIGAAIGIGFTLPEEFVYGGESSAFWIRMLTLAGHMIYGIFMAKHLGLAKYNRLNNKPRFLQYVLAILAPVFLHTLYDACTSNNLMMLDENTAIQDAGIIIGLAGTAIHIIGQFVVLYILKKNTEKYCNMTLLEQSAENETVQTTDPKNR